MLRGNISANMSFLDTIQVLRWAKDDLRICGIVLDLSTSGGRSSQLGFAQIQELRDEILSFAETKRQTHPQTFRLAAHTDTFESQIHYYLATAFDNVYMEPVGQIPLTGLGTVQPFFRNLLDKLGIGIHSYSRGEYKSVTSTFNSTGWSAPIRENMTRLLKSLNSQLVDGVTHRRKKIGAFDGDVDWGVEEKNNKHEVLPSIEIPDSLALVVSDDNKGGKTVVKSLNKNSPLKEKMEAIMDAAPVSSEEALSMGLVDKLVYKRDLLPIVAKAQSKTTDNKTIFHDIKVMLDPYISSSDNPKGFPCVQFNRYRQERLLQKQRNDKATPADAKKSVVGLVYVVGNIQRGDAPSASNHAVSALVAAANDPTVDSIVMRVDSPGGDPVASETVWDTVKWVRNVRKKPVVVSFGNVAASGGYYVAAAADRILAMPGTITGSVGVASMRPIVTKTLLERLGVTTDEILFSEGSKNLSLFHDITGKRLSRAKRQVDLLYDTFKRRVASGRGLGAKAIESVAGGRVWSGTDAVGAGLVDELGGIYRSIEVAAERGYNSRTERLAFTQKRRDDLKVLTDKDGKPVVTKNVIKINNEADKDISFEKDKPIIEIKKFPQQLPLLSRLKDVDSLNQAVRIFGDSLRAVAVEFVRSSWDELVIQETAHLNGVRLEADIPLK
ncbi:hypothetical protein HK096_001360, partial [Nowakowskiella sp. JEL0078]